MLAFSARKATEYRGKLLRSHEAKQVAVLRRGAIVNFVMIIMSIYTKEGGAGLRGK